MIPFGLISTNTTIALRLSYKSNLSDNLLDNHPPDRCCQVANKICLTKREPHPWNGYMRGFIDWCTISGDGFLRGRKPEQTAIDAAPSQLRPELRIIYLSFEKDYFYLYCANEDGYNIQPQMTYWPFLSWSVHHALAVLLIIFPWVNGQCTFLDKKTGP